jgi:hypothetical protein
MLRFFTVPRLALNPNLILEIGSSVLYHKLVDEAWWGYQAISLNMFRFEPL